MQKIIMILISGVLIAALFSCSEEAVSKEEPVVIATNIETMTVEPADFDRYMETIGVIIPAKDVPVIAEESGRLQRILVDKGQKVRKGQTIAILSNRVLSAQLKQAKAMYSSDSLSYVQQKELESVNGISKVALEQARFKMEASNANMELLQARVAKLRIKAFIGGLLDARSFDSGAYIPAMSNFGHIVDVTSVKVKIDMAERYAGLIDRDKAVQVTFDAYPGLIIDGKIKYIGSIIDPKSRTFPIEVYMDNRDERMKPNMMVNVHILLYRKQNEIVIPKDAIIDEGNFQAVFLQEGDLAIKRTVLIGDVYKENALISEGLKAGDILIITGNRDLVDSSRVRVIDGEK